MATVAQSLPQSSAPLTWIQQFLKEELAPYSGRAALVTRITLAATLIMIIGMTFRLPYSWQGAIYVLVVSRENTRATLQSGLTLLLVTGIGAAYLLVSVWFVINIPLLHFVWIIGTLFLAFYAVSVLTNYTAAVAFINLIAAGIPFWDRHVPAETNVEDTLWLCLEVLIAVVITAAVELAFVRLRPGDEVVLAITERLAAVENLVTYYAEGRTGDPGVEQKVVQLETRGTSLLRLTLRRSDYSRQYTIEMGAVAALVNRVVDLAATLTQLKLECSASVERRFRNLALALASIRNDLLNRGIPGLVQFDTLATDAEPAAVPLIAEMEHTVGLIPQAFSSPRSIGEYVPSADDLPRPAVVVPDALVNSQHLRFALKGCLAGSSCYVIYNAIAWPGISTAVTTCLLTALTTVGSSHQKQILRITGAMMGGFVLGMGSQVFILPYLDSIAGFMVLFVAVTALSSWFVTSSPRLSYFGIQVALAFYLINLNEFKIQTSLAVARDRVVGILLGLVIMWLVFDELWGAPAAVQMKKTIVSNLRLMAQFAREPVAKDLKTAMARSLALRETISSNLDNVKALADGVLLEFGPSREQDLLLRSRIRRFQPQLRLLFIMQIAAWKYAAQLPGFELPETISAEQRKFDEDIASTLDQMAGQMDGRGLGKHFSFESRVARLEHTVQAYCSRQPPEVCLRFQLFLAVHRRIESLITSLAAET
jgi:multidrug resistance protein MdtO